jgi:menaquinone-dependent protoporphyrinogen oxidase
VGRDWPPPAPLIKLVFVSDIKRAATQLIGADRLGRRIARPASAMAKQKAGDWRSPAHVRRWAKPVVDELQRPTIIH